MYRVLLILSLTTILCSASTCGEDVFWPQPKNDLHRAAYNNDPSGIEEALDKGISLDMAEEKTGYTAMHYAAKRGAHNAMYVLLQNVEKSGSFKALVNARDRNGRTPLHIVAYETEDNNYRLSHKECLKTLIKHGADIDAVDKNGDTPLHRAVQATQWGTSPHVEILLHHGARRDIRNGMGETPLDIAIRKFRETKRNLEECERTSVSENTCVLLHRELDKWFRVVNLL